MSCNINQVPATPLVPSYSSSNLQGTQTDFKNHMVVSGCPGVEAKVSEEEDLWAGSFSYPEYTLDKLASNLFITWTGSEAELLSNINSSIRNVEITTILTTDLKDLWNVVFKT